MINHLTLSCKKTIKLQFLKSKQISNIIEVQESKVLKAIERMKYLDRNLQLKFSKNYYIKPTKKNSFDYSIIPREIDQTEFIRSTNKFFFTF